MTLEKQRCVQKFKNYTLVLDDEQPENRESRRQVKDGEHKIISVVKKGLLEDTDYLMLLGVMKIITHISLNYGERMLIASSPQKMIQ